MFAVAVHREGHNRIGEVRAGRIPVQEGLRVREGVREVEAFAFFVGVRDVDAQAQDVTGQRLSELWGTLDLELFIARQAPHVRYLEVVERAERA